MSDLGGTTTVWPALRYANARAAIVFLVEAFGFEEKAVYGEGDRVDHAELAWPAGGGVMLGSVRPDSVLADLPAGVGAVYLVADDPDALFTRAVDAGAVVVQGLKDEDYGSRGFTCRDPEGVYWSFGTYTGE
ncbi:putative glyoxalase superfamily protein PhnB [Prescottella agglutinans]|uniref:Glyoxalase superfamily protein PhnB n=1 Tax=Prescottella agglutinans TaxID=1644129 RepID=A0ABT6MF50_9NOCA|nr:VOC family protein [Prescottella agglutinans]MDH6282949.1 putative glyoxalase superfamily protein PhnB [Prescottella agglutinans]